VIRGVLQKWECDQTVNEADLISEALLNILDENWNIIVYDTFVEESGYGDYCHYKDKWWVYGVLTINRNCDKQAIENFLDREFGWAAITDCSKVQTSAQAKINNNFIGNWRVHVVKLRIDSELTGSFWGICWKHSGYKFYVMRES
jgi:hypothetical protein